MDPKEARKRLRVELDELTAASEHQRDARATVELDQPSIGRLSRMDAIQGQEMAKAAEQRRQARIKGIRAALTRIEEDKFGFCTRCGDEIAAKRLDLDPATALCIDCMQER